MKVIEESGYEILNKIDSLYSTRETSTTNTIIDHIYTNVDSYTLRLSILDSSLSDHKQMYLEIGQIKQKIYKKIYDTTNQLTMKTYTERH